MNGWRWRLRTWSPDYDSARGDPRPSSEPRVDAGVEVPPSHWQPRGVGEDPRTGGHGAACVVFVDGVQRIDAWADLDGPDGQAGEALFASFAAGAVRVERGGPAVVAETRLGRALVGGPPGPLDDIVVGRERYRHQPVGDAGASGLDVGLQVARDRLEVEVAEAAVAGLGDTGGLVVVDGPLHHREHLAPAVGYVKSHRVEYLDEPRLRAVVAGLRPGERTPLFLIEAGWARFSWYSRLPFRTGPALTAPESHPDEGPMGWAGLVRMEASRQLPVAAAADLADRATRGVARFASSPVKDPRAPQNLVPVGGLERYLRHRLGERELLERALRISLSARPAAG